MCCGTSCQDRCPQGVPRIFSVPFIFAGLFVPRSETTGHNSSFLLIALTEQDVLRDLLPRQVRFPQDSPHILSSDFCYRRGFPFTVSRNPSLLIAQAGRSAGLPPKTGVLMFPHFPRIFWLRLFVGGVASRFPFPVPGGAQGKNLVS